MKSFAKLFLLLPLALGLSLASCKSSGVPSEPVEPEVVYTAESVCAEFNAALEAEGYGSLAAEWDEEYEEYSTGAYLAESTDESEENLLSAIETFAYFLPEYMELAVYIYGDPTAEDYYDLFGDNSIYLYTCFSSPDELVEAVIISYIYSGYLCAQLGIYDVVEE